MLITGCQTRVIRYLLACYNESAAVNIKIITSLTNCCSEKCMSGHKTSYCHFCRGQAYSFKIQVVYHFMHTTDMLYTNDLWAVLFTQGI